jgi:hypothetical protein
MAYQFVDSDDDSVEINPTYTCVSCGDNVEKIAKHPYHYKSMHCIKCIDKRITHLCFGMTRDKEKNEIRRCYIYTINHGCIYHSNLNNILYSKCAKKLIERTNKEYEFDKIKCELCCTDFYYYSDYHQIYNDHQICEDCFKNPKLKRCHNTPCDLDGRCNGYTLNDFCNACLNYYNISYLKKAKKKVLKKRKNKRT